MFPGLIALLDPHRHPDLLRRRRAEAVLLRVQASAALFAALTLWWIVVDATVLGNPWWKPLAATRLAAGCSFAALAIASRAVGPTLGNAYAALAGLYTVPLAFFFAAQQMLAGATLTGLAQGVGATYGFVPFVLAGAIALFPLVAAESAALAITAFGAQLWFVRFKGTAHEFASIEALWLLALIAGVASFAAMSQVKLMMALVTQAIRDPLTGCLRRESGLELLEMQLALAARRSAPLAVLFVDIDRFKQVNDDFGHEAGDAVLAATAAALRNATRASDSVVRWGGEEFLMVLPDATSADAVRSIERLRALGAGRLPDGRAVTVSIGIAEGRQDAEPDARRLVALADGRMYAAKQAGRNRYVRGGGDAKPVPIMAPEPALSR